MYGEKIMKSDYTYSDIVATLKEIGIEKGDDVFIHSNLGFFGILEGCKTAEELCLNFLNALRDIIGDRGTILTPTFSYSFCHGEIYDPKTTPTTCGMLAEYCIKNYPENRTMDPNFSVCGLGANMEDYLHCNIHETFGKDSFWSIFMKNHGKIICMNFDSGSTFIHYIERQNDVSYRYNKAFNGQYVINGVLKRDYAVHFVFDGDENAPSMERVHQLCKENGIFKQANLGKGMILSFSSEKYFDFFSNLLKSRPRVLCANEEAEME